MSNLPSATYKKILELLQKISTKTHLTTLALVKWDGSVISFFSETINNVEIQVSISAIVSSIGTTAQMILDKLKYGYPKEIVIRGEKGYTIFFYSDEYFLVGGGFDFKSIAFNLRICRYYFPKIYRAIFSNIMD